MLVTLPFILLLLDYWPGKRFAGKPGVWRNAVPKAVVEKLPFFALSAICCFITYQVQRSSTVMPLESYGALERVGNAIVAYAVYMRKAIWPADLAFFYPLFHRPAWQVVLSGLVLATITVAVFIGRGRRPFALAGWLWYLGMLVPVVGLVQVGEQSMADRYTYLPLVGLFIMVAWTAGEWLQSRRRCIPAAASLGLIAVLGCGILTWRQAACWKDTRSLLAHALAVTKDNFLAQNNLGFVLAREGEVDAASLHFREAIRIKPTYARAHRNLAAAFVGQGNLGKAAEHYGEALELQPGDVEALHNLGAVLARQGNLAEAATHCVRAVELEPENAAALYDYALVLNMQGKHQEAAARLTQSLQIMPDNPLGHFQLGLTLAQNSEWLESTREYERALVLRPDWPDALRELAWILATAEKAEMRSPERAVELAERAKQLTQGGGPLELTTLAAAYAATGRFEDAVATAEKAIVSSERAGMTRLAEQNRASLELYRKGKTYEPKRKENEQPVAERQGALIRFSRRENPT